MSITNSCVWIPNAENGKDSQLFQDLSKVLEDRRLASFLWGLSKDNALMEAMGITRKDNNGEYYAKDILDKLGGDKLQGDPYIEYIRISENLNKEYNKWLEAYKRYKEVKAKHTNLSFNIKDTGSGFQVDIGYITSENRGFDRQTEYNNSLVNNIITYLNTLGFKVAFSDIDDTSHTTPVSQADRLAEGLKTVITISNNSDMKKDLPEEFAHILIAGLRHTPLVQRLLNAIKGIGVKEILGDSYEQYRKKYNNSEDRLIEEAAGKMLADSINSKDEAVKLPLLKRLWNYIRGLFSGKSTRDVDNLIKEAKKYADTIVESLNDYDTIKYIDKENIYDLEEMHNLKGDVDALGQLAFSAMETLNKRLKLQRIVNPSPEANLEGSVMVSQIEQEYHQQQYIASISDFLKYALTDIEKLNATVHNFNSLFKNNPDDISVTTLRSALRIARDFNNVLKGYTPIFNELVSSNEELKEGLTESDLLTLEDYAKRGMNILQSVQAVYNDLVFNTLFKFFQIYKGNDWIIKSETGQTLSLTDLMSATTRDTSMISKLFCSIADSQDAFLTIVDYIIRNQEQKITEYFREYSKKIDSIHDKYRKASGTNDTSFIFHRDKDGNLTGMYISDIDYDKFFEERRRYKEERKAEGLKPDVLYMELERWNKDHLEPVTLPSGRTEYRPKRSLYPSNEYDNLIPAQKDYYDAMIDLKMELDAFIPSSYVKTYKAVQKEVDTVGEALITEGNAQHKIKQAFGTIKKKFIRNWDDIGFGQSLDDEMDSTDSDEEQNVKAILADFDNERVYRIPLYYIRRLDKKHMQNLSLDNSTNMKLYAEMAINFLGMSEIVDAVELMDDLNKRRRLNNENKNLKLVEKFSRNGRTYSRTFSQSMRDSNSSDVLRSTINRRLYKINTKSTPGIDKLSGYKAFQSLLGANSLVGLGWNFLTGLGAAFSGAIQIIIEGLAGLSTMWIRGRSNFNIGNSTKAFAYYMRHIHSIVADGFTGRETNEVTALYNYFNMGEEYRERQLYNNRMSAGILWKVGYKVLHPMLWLSAGDHILRSTVMMAYLDHYKVIKNGKEMSLLDAIEFKNGELALNGIINTDGTSLDLRQIQNEIQHADHGINGSFTERDKGVLADSMIGRLLMQFRGWMPALLTKRFGSKRFNALIGRETEGFYITAFHLTMSVLKDLRHGKFQLATRYKMLSDEQKTNVWRSISEIVTFWITFALCQMSEPPSDDDKSRSPIESYLEYALRRINLELGAMTLSPYFLSSMMTIFQNPLPAVNTIDRLLSIIDIPSWSTRIESGTYKGWTRIKRDLYYLTPMKNWNKSVSFINGDYTAFNIFNT